MKQVDPSPVCLWTPCSILNEFPLPFPTLPFLSSLLPSFLLRPRPFYPAIHWFGQLTSGCADKLGAGNCQSESGEFLKASSRGRPSPGVRGHGFTGDSLPYNDIKTRGPQPWDLMPDDLRWSWCNSNNNRNKLHSTYNVLESSWNHHSPHLPLHPPPSVEKLSPTKSVPGAKKFGDCWLEMKAHTSDKTEKPNHVLHGVRYDCFPPICPACMGTRRFYLVTPFLLVFPIPLPSREDFYLFPQIELYKEPQGRDIRRSQGGKILTVGGLPAWREGL